MLSCPIRTACLLVVVAISNQFVVYATEPAPRENVRQALTTLDQWLANEPRGTGLAAVPRDTSPPS